MYDDVIRKNILDDLEGKVMSIINTSIALASQGYLVNKSKYIRLDWSSLLLHAFENIDVLKPEQQHCVELLYNRLSTI